MGKAKKIRFLILLLVIYLSLLAIILVTGRINDSLTSSNYCQLFHSLPGMKAQSYITVSPLERSNLSKNGVTTGNITLTKIAETGSISSTEIYSLRIGNFTPNGYFDIVAAGSSPCTNVSVYSYQNSSLDYFWHSAYEANYVTNVAFGDSDNDGFEELIVSQSSDAHKAYVEKYINGSVQQQSYLGCWWEAGSSYVVNLDNDGENELLISICGNNMIGAEIWSWTGSSYSVETRLWSIDYDTICIIGDFDANGIINIAMTSSSCSCSGPGGGLRIYEYINDDYYVKRDFESETHFFTNPEAGDLDGDGSPEIILKRNNDSEEIISVYDYNSSSGNYYHRDDIVSSSLANIHGIGDVDNDGRDEVFISYTDCEAPMIAYGLNDTGDLFKEYYFKSSIHRGIVKDLDGDNKIELIGSTGNKIAVFLITLDLPSPTTTTPPPTTTTPPTETTTPPSTTNPPPTTTTPPSTTTPSATETTGEGGITLIIITVGGIGLAICYMIVKKYRK